MFTQEPLTVGQARTIRQDGGVEFVTHGASIQPDRHRFANLEELKAYLGQVLGGQPEGGGIRGSMSRKGTYSRRAADGTQAVTFGDPVLDAISSAAGTLVIGDQTIDLREDHGSPEAPTGASGVVVLNAPSLKFTDIVNGAERYASEDGSLVQYRLGAGRLTFNAWKKHSITQYWSMGAEITTSGTHPNFQAAAIDSHYYMSVTAPCQLVKIDADSDRDDSYVDEYEWGWKAPQPERVASLCRAQWNNARFADIVTAGEGCLNYLDDVWPVGFPPDWVTIDTVINLNGSWTDGSPRNADISVLFTSLTIDMSAFGRPTAHGSIVDGSTITVTFPDDATYTGSLQPPGTIRWSNGSAWTKV